MLRKSRYKTWITLDEALFHLSSTTGKTEIQSISREKQHRDAVALQKASWLSGIMAWIGISSQGLTKPLLSNQKLKLMLNIIRIKIESHNQRKKALYPPRNFVFHKDFAPNHIAKSTKKLQKDKEK